MGIRFFTGNKREYTFCLYADHLPVDGILFYKEDVWVLYDGNTVIVELKIDNSGFINLTTMFDVTNYFLSSIYEKVPTPFLDGLIPFFL